MRSILGFSLLLTLATICTACASAATDDQASPAVGLHGHLMHVEIAADNPAREHGLMDRTNMAPDRGMLFVFPDDDVRTFWMKDTLIPLDMLFFDAQRRLVTLRADVPPCKADPCALYPSTLPARYVLELNAGAAKRLGVHEGDVATFIDVPAATQ